MKKSKKNIFNSLLTYDNKELFKDSINIDFLKNKLNFLRKNNDKNKLFVEEIKSSNMSFQNIIYRYVSFICISLNF